MVIFVCVDPRCAHTQDYNSGRLTKARRSEVVLLEDAKSEILNESDM